MSVSNVLYIFQAVTSVFGALLCTYVATNCSYSIYKYPQKLQNTIHRRLALFTLISYSLSMILMFIFHILYNNRLLIVVFGIFWGNASCAGYLLFINRFRATFSNTILIGQKRATPKSVYISLYICVLVFYLAHLCLMTIITLQYFQAIDLQTYEMIHSTELVIKSACDIFLSTVLCYLFVSKLMNLSMTSVKREIENHAQILKFSTKNMACAEDERTLNVVSKASQLTNKDNNWISIATKMTILASTTLIATEFVFILALIANFINLAYGENGYVLHQIFWNFGTIEFVMIDSCINSLCIFMSLPYEQSKVSYRYMCRCCHTSCGKCRKNNLQKKKLRMGYQLMQEL